MTNIEYPKSATRISENLDCIIRTQAEKHEWSIEEQRLIDKALERLRREPDEEMAAGYKSDDDYDDSD